MKIKKFLPLIGIVLFVIILIKLDLNQIFEEIKNARLAFLFVAFSFVLVVSMTETSKWFVIARSQKTRVPFIEAVRINLISSFYGFVTPSKIGSAMRAEYLKKYNGNLGKGLSNFVLDKVLDICSIVFLVTVFSFVFKDVLGGLIYYAIFILLFMGFCLFIFMDKKRSHRILRVFYRKLIPQKFKKKMSYGFHAFYKDMPKKRHLVFFFLVNLFNWVAVYTVGFFVGKAVGIEVPFIYFLAILPVGTLIAQIPITVNGLGTREATVIALFGLLGIGAAKVFSMSIITLVLSGIPPALIGGLLSLRKKNA